MDANGGQEERVPAMLRERYASIVSLTDSVCQDHLTEEYAAPCRRMAAKLCRKRPSPGKSGQAASWAAGIVHALGSINFLFDKNQTPHLPAIKLCALFGVSPSNAAARAGQLRKLFALTPFQAEWSLASRREDNPLLWMVSVNGFILDIRTSPRDFQELAVAKNLIPHLPVSSRDLDR